VDGLQQLRPRASTFEPPVSLRSHELQGWPRVRPIVAVSTEQVGAWIGGGFARTHTDPTIPHSSSRTKFLDQCCGVKWLGCGVKGTGCGRRRNACVCTRKLVRLFLRPQATSLTTPSYSCGSIYSVTQHILANRSTHSTKDNIHFQVRSKHQQ
jgi:hypothetical protein